MRTEPRVGDMVELAICDGKEIIGKMLGVVVGIVTCSDDLKGTGFDALSFDPWPKLNPLFIATHARSGPHISFWAGDKSLPIVFPVEDTMP